MRASRFFAYVACFAYLTLLTALLLTPDPGKAIGLKRIPWFLGGDVGAHFCAFLLLAMLLHATYWPQPLHWLSIAILLGYGVATESLQCFVPLRSVELKDYLNNFLGVAVGSLGYWFLLRIRRIRREKNACPTRECEIIPDVVDSFPVPRTDRKTTVRTLTDATWERRS